jgi:3-oxoadipate enol-lactonase
MVAPTTRAVVARGALATALTAAAASLYAAGRARRAPSTPALAGPPLPGGRTILVPGHGEMFVRDLPGPPGGPTIVLLHGWMFPADATWFPALVPLSRIGRVIAIDHRGHGRGARPPEPFRLADVAGDVAALLRHLDARPAVVVGYSMGGAIAQLLARRDPDVVAGLVLCATAATFSGTFWERHRWRTMGALQVVLRLLPRAAWERAAVAQARGRLPVRITRLVHRDTPEQVLDLLPWMVGELTRGSAEDVAEAGREMGRYEARDWLGELAVPATVLVTARDQLVPPARQRELAAAIPGARRVELPLDHDAPVGAAERFVPALVEAVAALASPGRAGEALSHGA